MDDLVEFELINSLFDLYGNLLTYVQKHLVEQYYVYNLSLAEIAEEDGISRTAVSDALKKSIAKLKKYEDNLHIVDKSRKIKSLLNDIDGNEDVVKKIKEVL